MDEFPKLVNKDNDSVITVNNSSFSIGRSLSCDHIIECLGVSRFHCIIKKNHDKWTLFDRSTNGTIVNSKLYKFNESVDLKHGDVITLGPKNLDFVFNYSRDSQDRGEGMESVETPRTEHQEVGVEENLAVNLIDQEVLEEFSKPFEASPVAESKPEPEQKPELEMMENELTCSICSELFIKAVTLNCSHTFCKFCIDRWMLNKSSCPICRKFITTTSPTLVLDNFIEKFISTQDEETKETRKALIEQREKMVENTASGSNTATNTEIDGGHVIEIFSDDDGDYMDEDEDEDSDVYDDDHDYDVYECYDRPSHGAYYGGYGRCYICNQSGHWANSCPFKRR